MRLNGRRTSSNVEDRRGSGFGSGFSGGGMNLNFGRTPKLGCGGIILLLIVMLIFKVNPLTLISGLGDSGFVQTEQTQAQVSTEDDELAQFASQILAGTEDVWSAVFEKMGKTYIPPKMVLFSGAVRSACGNASSSTGPFYCSADQTVYLDLSFFKDMKRQLGADGDFAYAYVIAHEVGHHVQYLLGTLQQVTAKQQRSSEKISNQLNVRLELQADFYAGIWAYYDNKMYKSLEDGDIEEGLNAATAIGDDRLQMQAQGYTVPDSFNHGTSKQRNAWLKKGITTGDVSLGDTFSPAYNKL